jgi:hypothetical protein
MTQYGSGSGVPLTGFTYDLAGDDAVITTRSEVRLQTGDSVQGAGPRPGGGNYSDVEIDYFLAQEGGHLQRAAALALETLASEWAKEASKQQLGPSSSEAHQARAFAERAAALRKAYGYTDASFRPGSGPATSGYISWKLFYAEGGL